jgi:ABC-2 type transport system permease protein
MARSLVVFLDLYLMQLANYRWTWRWQLISGLIAPVSFMFVLKTLLANDPSAATSGLGAHILAGNLVMSVLLTTMGHASNRFAWLKETEGLDYYATLPIDRALMVVTVILAFVTLSIPQLAGTVLLGKMLFGLPLTPHLLSPLVIVLAALSLAGVGAGIGILAPDMPTEAVLANLAAFLMLFLSPVLIPAERLPAVLQVTSRLLPTSYAVEALRRLLVGTLDERVALDLAILAGFSIVSLYVATRRLDWRRR